MVIKVGLKVMRLFGNQDKIKIFYRSVNFQVKTHRISHPMGRLTPNFCLAIEQLPDSILF
jgi:hypothetical protein